MKKLTMLLAAGAMSLAAFTAEAADNLRFRHALGTDDKLRTFETFLYQAKSWSRPRRVIARLEDGSFRYELDGGTAIEVAVTVDRTTRRARIDFAGTSAQLPGNFNAPPAVTRAAVLYVFRTLVEDDIPLNEGCLEPLDIVIPEGSLLAPRHPAAVVAGNVETSQCVVDALYGALGVQAAAQGTMNNFTFGDDEAQYYETVCGGSGAGSSWSAS